MYRIACIFQCIFLLFFTLRKYRLSITIAFLAVFYLFTSLNDFLGFFVFNESFIFHYVWAVLTVALSVLFSLIISIFRDMRAVFTAITSLCVVLAGNIFCLICYAAPCDIHTGFIAQIIINILTQILLFRQIRPDYTNDQEIEKNGWGLLTLIPLFFYIAIFNLCYWPLQIWKHIEMMPGIVLILLLMYITLFVFEKMISLRHDITKEQKINFLMNYSDKIRIELNRISLMHRDLKLHQESMQNISKVAIKLLDQGNFDQLRDVISNMNSEGLVVPELNYSNNIIVNSVLFGAEQKADNAQVKLNYNINIPATYGDVDYEYANIVETFLLKAIHISSESNSKTVNLAMYSAGDSQTFEIRTDFPEAEFAGSKPEERYLYEYKEILNHSLVANFIKSYKAKCNFKVYNKSITAELIVKL